MVMGGGAGGDVDCAMFLTYFLCLKLVEPPGVWQFWPGILGRVLHG